LEEGHRLIKGRRRRRRRRRRGDLKKQKEGVQGRKL